MFLGACCLTTGATDADREDLSTWPALSIVSERQWWEGKGVYV